MGLRPGRRKARIRDDSSGRISRRLCRPRELRELWCRGRQPEHLLACRDTDLRALAPLRRPPRNRDTKRRSRRLERHPKNGPQPASPRRPGRQTACDSQTRREMDRTRTTTRRALRDHLPSHLVCDRTLRDAQTAGGPTRATSCSDRPPPPTRAESRTARGTPERHRLHGWPSQPRPSSIASHAPPGHARRLFQAARELGDRERSPSVARLNIERDPVEHDVDVRHVEHPKEYRQPKVGQKSIDGERDPRSRPLRLMPDL